MKQDGIPCVAIVDDEEDFVRLLIRLFQKRGIPVSFVAHDGGEAVEKFNEADVKPDVILMDHHMITMDGIENTRRILSGNKNTRIIFLSADMQIREEALNAGACAFLSKPIGVNEIVKAINSCES